jgi:hypothetical protein
LPIHVIAGLGGWMTLTAIGVSYRLLSMFMLAPDVDERKSRVTWFLGSLALGVAVVGGAVAIMITQGLDLILLLAAVAGVATLLGYARDVLSLYGSRKRRVLELNTRMAAWSLATLGVAAVLGLALLISGALSRHVGALVFLVAFGWLSGLILASLYKIVPFLTWLETYGPVMGKVPTPRVQDLAVERRGCKWLVMYFGFTWVATAMLLFESPVAFQIAAAGMIIATLGILKELVRARRLADVAEPLRLPAGALVPNLLFCRTSS